MERARTNAVEIHAPENEHPTLASHRCCQRSAHFPAHFGDGASEVQRVERCEYVEGSGRGRGLPFNDGGQPRDEVPQGIRIPEPCFIGLVEQNREDIIVLRECHYRLQRVHVSSRAGFECTDFVRARGEAFGYLHREWQTVPSGTEEHRELGVPWVQTHPVRRDSVVDVAHGPGSFIAIYRMINLQRAC